MRQEKPVAVITGAARGIGYFLALSCLKEGMRVVMADCKWDSSSIADLSLTYGNDVLKVVCDITSKRDVLNLVHETKSHYSRVDYLFNNAGITHSLQPIWELSDEVIDKVMQVNVKGAIYCIQAFLPWMFEQKHRSRVVNMASIYGLCSGSLVSAYAMSKHAIVALSESLYFDLKRLNKPVDVSVVCPSFVNTGLLDEQNALNDWMRQARNANEVAIDILKNVLNGIFYVMPDAEVKNYFDEKAKAILHQMPPHQHSLEKIVSKLVARVARETPAN